LPVACMISAVPQPSGVRRMMFARQNLLLRAAEVRSNRFKLGAAGSAQWDGPSLVHSSDESGSESISEWKGQILVHQLR